MSWLPRLRAAILFGFLPALLCCLALGCGKGGHHISGKVKYKGQPIPSGRIYFIPDTKKGNSGPTGYAEIKDGQYDTSADGGQGIVGGPTIVAIEGTEPVQPAKAGGPTVKTLFPRYETSVDLPKETTTKDFDVPAATPKGPVKKGGGK